MADPVKVLLAGVPFGRDNLGDESILENVVAIVREIRPEAEITVSTDDPEPTAKKLDVKTVQLFGFAPPYSREFMKRTLRENDIFIWSGATGLSDYPEIPLEMLQIAQRAGTKTVLWGVGMNANLNPVKYKLLPGKRRTVLRLASALSLGVIDFVALEESRRERRTRSKIASTLSRADLVALRDPESIVQARRCGDLPNLLLGCDSAIIQRATTQKELPFDDEILETLKSADRKVGVCISAQREVTNSAKLVAFFDKLVEEGNIRIVFLPMNPVTDLELMASLRAKMKSPARSVVIKGQYEPADIVGVASCLDCVISSRLHLLILSSIVHLPLIGISRGSKVDNFLSLFGLDPAGSVEDCDFEYLYKETLRLLDERGEFEKRSRKVRTELLERLTEAKKALKEVLG